MKVNITIFTVSLLAVMHTQAYGQNTKRSAFGIILEDHSKSPIGKTFLKKINDFFEAVPTKHNLKAEYQVIPANEWSYWANPQKTDRDRCDYLKETYKTSTFFFKFSISKPDDKITNNTVIRKLSVTFWERNNAEPGFSELQTCYIFIQDLDQVLPLISKQIIHIIEHKLPKPLLVIVENADFKNCENLFHSFTLFLRNSDLANKFFLTSDRNPQTNNIESKLVSSENPSVEFICKTGWDTVKKQKIICTNQEQINLINEYCKKIASANNQ
jgi:hypothetical protein